MDPAQREGCGRHQGRDESEDDGVLVDVDEDDRGHEGDQEPADQPAGRDQEVEASEVGGRRAQAGESAVAAERHQGEDEQVDEAEREDRAAEGINDREEDESQRQCARKNALRHQLAPREGVDEGAEIERERHDPEERHRRHVGGQVLCDREEERAGNGRQRKDAHHGQRGPGGEIGCRDRRGRGRAATDRCRPENDEQRCKAEENGTPEPGLTVQSEQGLEKERIGQQGACGARVRGRVQEVGVDRGRTAAGPCQPGLDQRGEGRGGNEGDPERTRQRSQQPDGGRKIAGGVSHEAEFACRCRKGDTDPENSQQGDLPGGRHVPDEKMREGIARQQRRLEEHHGGIPDRRRAPEDGEDIAHRERLYPEHEPRRGEDDQAVEPGRRRDSGDEPALQGIPGRVTVGRCRTHRADRSRLPSLCHRRLSGGDALDSVLVRHVDCLDPVLVRHVDWPRRSESSPIPGDGESADPLQSGRSRTPVMTALRQRECRPQRREAPEFHLKLRTLSDRWLDSLQ